MAIRPTHKPAGGLPRYFFVGRRDEISIFAKTLESNCAPDEYSILTISALGGQGKSSLLARMRELLKEEKYAEFPSAAIDFDLAAQRDPVNALILLRNQFAAAGVATNAFDIAFARHFVLTRPGRDIRADHPELFKFSSDLLGDVADTLGSIITELPGAKLVYSILSKLSHKGLEWYRKRGEPLLAQLDEIPAHHLRAELPMFLGADLSAYCAEASNKRLVIFYDTHEALWRGTQRIDSAAETAPDSWLRRFVQETPRILHVIAGRRPLDWPKIDEEWSKYITSIDLRELDDECADEIFDRAALTSQAIRKRILQSSLGHALTLRVNVRIYETLIGQGKTPEPEDFPLVAREAFDRFFDHLDVHTRAVIRALAIPQYIDDEIWDHLAQSGFPAFAYVSRGEVLDEVYFRKDEDGRHLMHELVRDGIRESLAKDDPALLKRLHEAMFAYHDDRSKYYIGVKVGPEARTQSLRDAADHLIAHAPDTFSAWCLDRFSSDLAEVTVFGERERLLEKARKLTSKTTATNWRDVVKLALIEARIRPFSTAPTDLIDSTRPFWSQNEMDEPTLKQLRSILWLLKATGQNARFEKLAPTILKLCSHIEQSKFSRFEPLELLIAIEAGDKNGIIGTIDSTIGLLEEGHSPSWCSLAGILLASHPDGERRLRSTYEKQDDDVKLIWLHRILTAASEIEQDAAGIELVCRLAQLGEDRLPDALLSWNAAPSFRCMALLQLMSALRASKRDEAHACNAWTHLESKFPDWELWTMNNFRETASQAIPTLDEAWPAEKQRIDSIRAQSASPWEGVESAYVYAFISDDGQVCIVTSDFRFCRREIDFVAYYDRDLYFSDRRYGLFTFGGKVSKEIGKYLSAGTVINLLTIAPVRNEAVEGHEHTLHSFETEEQVRIATDLSKVSDSIH
ncbi:MAG: hypothetical protein KIT15_11435 [Xanthobacteraceae bacterium]|nr:hypothetical protein [Xanthobacteraceae bacterium]MCW5675179.1 hypothetical protein [Xanthobacteraceae bacterium]